MYSSSSRLLSCHTRLQCPECFKTSPTQKLHVFKTSKGLARHLHEHSITIEERERIVQLSKVFETNSFLSLCFEVGVLY